MIDDSHTKLAWGLGLCGNLLWQDIPPKLQILCKPNLAALASKRRVLERGCCSAGGASLHQLLCSEWPSCNA